MAGDTVSGRPEKPEISKWLMYTYLASMLFMVVAYNIVNKLQNEILSPSNKKFDHPYL